MPLSFKLFLYWLVYLLAPVHCYYFLINAFILYRILLTSILRWSWLILLIMPSVMTQELNGSAILSISTGSSVALPLLERNTEVFVEKDTCTTKLVLLAEPHGRETILSPFVATVNHCYGILSSLSGSCLEDMVVAILSSFRD